MRHPEIDKFRKLEKGSHIHLMGICGTAMGSLAGILQEQGYKVTGSDQNVYPPMSTQLENLGIKIKKGFVKENLSPAPDFVVVGNVMTKKMEEVQALMESEIPFSSFPELLGELFLKEREAVVLCGTHGKTTSTSMMSWALDVLGEKPGYLIGGIPLNFKKSFSSRDSKWFVVEGDEYDTAFFDKVPKFKHYHPKNAVLTSVEFDHVDIYKDLSEVLSAFRILLQKIGEEKGLLVYNGEDKNIQKLLKETSSKDTKLLAYGRATEAQVGLDSELLEERVLEKGTLVKVRMKQEEYSFLLPCFGTYNSLNFLAVLTLLKEKGLPIEKLMDKTESFLGVARRQEKLYESKSLLVFEDFAHHPTAVSLTLDSFRKRFPKKRIIAVFEPRSATSRRDIFQKDYAKSFAQADLAFIAPVQTRSEKDTFSSQKLAEDIEAQGGAALSPERTLLLPDLIEENLQKNDVVVFMSNGGFENVQKIFTEKAQKTGL